MEEHFLRRDIRICSLHKEVGLGNAFADDMEQHKERKHNLEEGSRRKRWVCKFDFRH